MIEIKFRIWDKVRKKMVYLNKAIPFYAPEEWGYGQESYYLKINKTGGTRHTAVTFDCVIMQYTGLKDKNGNEIYEGDIVKLSETNPVLFKVEIILAKFGYKTIFRHVSDGTIAENGYFLSNCVVIGNIHESEDIENG